MVLQRRMEKYKKRKAKNTHEYFRSRCFRQQLFKPSEDCKIKSNTDTAAIWLIAE